ncbi:MAG: hypothetical protein J6K04_10195 [Lachnospiraceae bacterium]|nr:hypothetical protein [Lachnospiraceae bacterium]
MYFCDVNFAAFQGLFGDAVVVVDDFDIPVAEVGIVAINKAVVLSGYGVIFNAVTGENIHLHAVICDKEVIAAFHDFMVGIVEQIINIKTVTAGLAIII